MKNQKYNIIFNDTTCPFQCMFSSTDVKLVLYGSSLSSVGTKESDVNIDLVVPHKANHAKALMQAFKIIKTLGMHYCIYYLSVLIARINLS